MNARDFCFWLQGKFELDKAGGGGGGFTPDQARVIEQHLALVFIHEIDPSMGDAAHQGKLNETHAPAKPVVASADLTGFPHGPPVFRC